jgi:hypothetical protein
MIKKVLFSAVMLAAIVGVYALPAKAAKSEKVTICHRDNNPNQPYGPKPITVSKNAVDGEGKSDHYGVHTGPLASSVKEAELLKSSGTKWGDIIPPIGDQPGLNWTTEGQAIYNNDCQFPTTPSNPGNTGGDDDSNQDQDDTPDDDDTSTPGEPGKGDFNPPAQDQTPATPVDVRETTQPVTPSTVDVLPYTAGDHTLAYTLIAAGLATIVTGLILGIKGLYRHSA